MCSEAQLACLCKRCANTQVSEKTPGAAPLPQHQPQNEEPFSYFCTPGEMTISRGNDTLGSLLLSFPHFQVFTGRSVLEVGCRLALVSV